MRNGRNGSMDDVSELIAKSLGNFGFVLDRYQVGFQERTRMFDFSRFSISKAHLRKPMTRLLSSTAILVGLSASTTTNLPLGSACCQAQCPSCECSQCAQAYEHRTKPFSVLQLGSLVDGIDHFSDHLERKLLHQHHHFHSGSCDCAACDAHVATSIQDTTWSTDSETSILQPQSHGNIHQGPVGTGVSGKAKSDQSPQPLNPSSVPSLQVPGVAPHEDYQNNPFHDDARAKTKAPEKFKNRYTERTALNNAKTPNTKANTSESAKPQYSHAYQPEQFVAQQRTAQQNIPAKPEIQRNPVELASAQSVRSAGGIRVKVGANRPIAHEPVSTQVPAVYETNSSSNDLVQPAAALRLSN